MYSTCYYLGQSHGVRGVEAVPAMGFHTSRSLQCGTGDAHSVWDTQTEAWS